VPETALEKVTCLVTRTRGEALELLVFEHPTQGHQLPAGTVEIGEGPEDAARREALEETGLADFASVVHVGSERRAVRKLRLPGLRVTHAVLRPAPVLTRPDPLSSSGCRLRRGMLVEGLRSTGAYRQVRYRELDSWPEPRYASFELAGWVPKSSLGEWIERHFFHLHTTNPTPSAWTVTADGARLRLFWAQLDALPPLGPQDRWLRFVRENLGYDLRRGSHGSR